MPLFIIFIFGAVIIGAGIMLSPAWPSSQPRIGLAAALSLALIAGGTVFYSSLFGWDTLVIDYLLFALVTGIFLGGTLSIGQARAEARGEVLEDADQGWPGPQDIAFFILIMVFFAAPVFVLGVPSGTTAQGYGFLALVTREGGTFHTFAPFLPEVEYLYAPGFNALTAYLSQQLNQDIASVQFSVGAVLCLMNVLIAYDFGAELRDKRLGRAMALVMMLSPGLLGAFLEGHYPAIMAMTFVQAFFIYVLRYRRHRYPADAFTAGLMLGATAITHPGMTLVALLGYIPWLATMWLGEPRPVLKTWVVLAFGIPLVTLLSIAPWLVEIRPLLAGDFASPFTRDVSHINVMINYHGVWIIPAALLGAWLGWLRRDPMTILAVGWLLLILDFSTTGGIASLLPFITRFAHPLDLAWHGPIIPYAILGGAAILWLWDEYIRPYTGALTYRHTYVISIVLIGVILMAGYVSPSLRGPLRAVLTSPGTLATNADIAAMRWLRENTTFEGTRILNFPEAGEGEWVSGIAERDAVYYPLLPYATTDADSITERRALEAFWRDPVAAGVEPLHAAGITHVIVPQLIAEPERFEDSWRWGEPPAPELIMRSSPSAVEGLERVFEQDGAAIYAVRPLEADSE